MTNEEKLNQLRGVIDALLIKATDEGIDVAFVLRYGETFGRGYSGNASALLPGVMHFARELNVSARSEKEPIEKPKESA